MSTGAVWRAFFKFVAPYVRFPAIARQNIPVERPSALRRRMFFVIWDTREPCGYGGFDSASE